jgi:mono/diheme cytochrome c family protein
MTGRLMLVAAVFAANAFCADALLERGEKEEARSCIACHSLRIVHSQRLTQAAWGRGLDKMAGWGTNIADREALLAYLSANFGNDKPLPAPGMTKDGSSAEKR